MGEVDVMSSAHREGVLLVPTNGEIPARDDVSALQVARTARGGNGPSLGFADSSLPNESREQSVGFALHRGLRAGLHDAFLSASRRASSPFSLSASAWADSSDIRGPVTSRPVTLSRT